MRTYFVIGVESHTIIWNGVKIENLILLLKKMPLFLPHNFSLLNTSVNSNYNFVNMYGYQLILSHNINQLENLTNQN